MTTYSNKSHRSQITREERVLGIQYIIGSGLTQEALNDPGGGQ